MPGYQIIDGNQKVDGLAKGVTITPLNGPKPYKEKRHKIIECLEKESNVVLQEKCFRDETDIKIYYHIN